MKLALLFPGQGSQIVGMGRDLAEHVPASGAVYARADAALGFGLSRLCFEGPEADLVLTANTQPALLATSVAILAAIRERWPALPTPTCAAGHSLGEYAALVAAGALAFEDALLLVRARGAAMQHAVPAGEGSMAAIVGLDGEAVGAACVEAAQGEVVAPANFNAPGQVVIAGHAAAVARASTLAAARGGKAIALKVSAPFHCALMAPAARALDERLAQVRAGAFAFPVVANVDATPYAAPALVRERLVRQVDHAVLWEASVRALVAMGVTHAIEVGPGKVLAGLAKRIARDLPVLSVADVAGVESLAPWLA